jgi:paraquat-inducible protein B
MSRRASPTLVGAFVLGGVTLGVIAIVRFGSWNVFQRHLPCVMYFEDSVNGLNVGAPIKIKGVQIGTVVGMDLPSEDTQSRIPVYAELTKARTYFTPMMTTSAELLETIIERGLRARLDTESYVTGVLYVDLEFEPTEPATRVGIGPSGYVEIPTLPRRFTNFLQKAMATLSDVKLKEMVDTITATAKSIDDLLHSPQIEHGIAQAGQTIQQYRDLAETLDANIRNLSKKLDATLDSTHAMVTQADKTLKAGEDALNSVRDVARDVRQDASTLTEDIRNIAKSAQDIERHLDSALAEVDELLDPGAPLVQQLHATLVQLARASRNLARFADELERNPAMIIRGKDDQEK